MSQVSQSNDRKIICVLGMHRSGTSLLTRAVNLLGVYLGSPTSLLPARDDNPTGFWEHEAISRLNEEILFRLGGSWHEPPVLPAGWPDLPRIADLRPRAQAIIQEFADHRMWGWKDPRTCLTLPFWQRLLPPMHYVICLRNPLDVARSLAPRDDFSLAKGAHLWLTYLNSALQQTTGQPRVQIGYEDFMADWRRELRRLSQFLGTADLVERPDVQDQMQQFISDSLHHHRASLLETVDEPGLVFPVRALYLAHRLHARLNHTETTDEQALDTLSRHSLEAYEQHLDWQKQTAEIEALRKQVLEKEKNLKAITSTFGWRLLTSYGRIKYPYLLPIYKLLGRLPGRRKSAAAEERLAEKSAGTDKI